MARTVRSRGGMSSTRPVASATSSGPRIRNCIAPPQMIGTLCCRCRVRLSRELDPADPCTACRLLVGWNSATGDRSTPASAIGAGADGVHGELCDVGDGGGAIPYNSVHDMI